MLPTTIKNIWVLKYLKCAPRPTPIQLGRESAEIGFACSSIFDYKISNRTLIYLTPTKPLMKPNFNLICLIFSSLHRTSTRQEFHAQECDPKPPAHPHPSKLPEAIQCPGNPRPCWWWRRLYPKMLLAHNGTRHQVEIPCSGPGIHVTPLPSI